MPLGKRFLVLSHWLFSSQLGVDSRRMIRFGSELPRFVREFRLFRKAYSGTLRLMPCLHDRTEQGGTVRSEYFWQDLLVARWVCVANPKRHVDIGSRVDGFVAHVASFREIEVFDVRSNTAPIAGVTFKQVDAMDKESVSRSGSGYCDSLSCLHALEHFGLGRYGDPIDAQGHEKGVQNMACLLEPGGTLYLSVPIGRERVEFNAHRVFDPVNLIDLVERQGLILRRMTVIAANGDVRDEKPTPQMLQLLGEQSYHLGLFVFTRSGTMPLEPAVDPR